jgi:hypothetical protein
MMKIAQPKEVMAGQNLVQKAILQEGDSQQVYLQHGKS